MATFRHLAHYVKTYRWTRKPVYIFGVMMLFWALYEGIVSYLAPIVITESGLSKTMMGIVIGSSSVAGAVFDFVACRIFKDTNFKRLFVIMFALCLIYPLILFKANSFVVYLIAMAIWGVYFDLKNIAGFNYVGRYTEKKEHADSFGLIQVFQALGFLIAPFIVGAMVGEAYDWQPFVMAWIFLVMAIVFFGFLIVITKKRSRNEEDVKESEKLTTWAEVVMWGRIGRLLFPVLFLTLFLNVIDAFFWTVGPLLAESLAGLDGLGGMFMAAYTLPTLLVGWIVGGVTRRYGKKRTAFVSLLLGSGILSGLFLFETQWLVIVEVFVASIFISMSWPAMNGAYADYISETEVYEKEIEGLEDLYSNLGYVVGPMLAGWMADGWGNAEAFSLLGMAGVIAAVGLMAVTPKEIKVANFEGGSR